ncbi:hypothetical protein BDW22DRAFT_1335931 [Trametopsis cervina]|nr:hypothetical protein BDW22DRAFT_1335931 [Trametopsis cervina]
MRTPTILPLLLLSAAAVATADVKYVNYTIDDQNGDQLSGRLVEYSPPGYWSQGNGCDHCAFHPNNQSAFNDTWHDGFRVPSRDFEPLAFQFKFNGTAFYIFNILVRLTLTDVNITLDGTLVGSYTRFANVSEQEQFLYNVPIFAHDYIPYGEHTVGVSAFGPYQTNVLFDYAVYTCVCALSFSSLPLPSSPSAIDLAGY